MIRRSPLVYGSLLAAWCVIVGWQAAEHFRVQRAARAGLIARAKDITTTLGLVIRSQRRFGSIVSQERLEPALNELVKTGELNAVALLNVAGEMVATAGAPIDFESKGAVHVGARWEAHTVTLVNLVDLGTNVVAAGESPRPIIVMPRRDPAGGTNSERRDFPRDGWRPNNPGETNSLSGERRPPPPGEGGRSRDDGGRPPDGERPRDPGGRPPFGRPPWMTEPEYQSLIQKQGLHSFVVVMSTQTVQAATTQDFWLRSIIGGLGAIAAAGLALAWRNVEKSSGLQTRLLRASELNNHLKEMNIAAAGLAHETRNPLNIIRGQAQLISKQPDATPEIREKTRAIADEVDRVTAQLNEFINYSKPRELRRAPVALGAVVNEVVRALQCDLEDKAINLSVANTDVMIEADEQLLRQLLFNLLLNAVQAVEVKGEIRITARALDAFEASLEVADNGPGVPPGQRQEIFKPYFTTHQKGTGLGLAVVQQIVLAHGWEIQCLAHEPRGAAFRLSHLKLTPSAVRP